jgi:hypothetical protein
MENGIGFNLAVYQPKRVVTVRGAGSVVHDGTPAAPWGFDVIYYLYLLLY